MVKNLVSQNTETFKLEISIRNPTWQMTQKHIYLYIYTCRSKHDDIRLYFYINHKIQNNKWHLVKKPHVKELNGHLWLFFKGFSIISIAIFSFKEKHTSLSVPQKRPTQSYVVLHRKLEGVN